jgi:DNA polymerase
MVDFAANPSRQAALRNPKRILLDFEIRCVLNLKEVGAVRFCQDPSARILVLKYKERGAGKPMYTWRPRLGEPFPDQLRKYVEEGWTFEAHNAGFEKGVWRYMIEAQYGVKMPEHWTDTQASCAYRSIPLDLDKAGRALGLLILKDKRGKFLISKLCVPQKWSKKEIKAGLNIGIKWCDDPALMAELDDYCDQDVLAEEALGDAIRDLPSDEYEVWCLDALINQRGVYIDIEAVLAADVIRKAVEVNLLRELREITGDEEMSADTRDRLKDWCETQGVYLPDLTADTVKDMLRPEKLTDTPVVRRVLEIRQALGKTSIAKIEKFITMRCIDGRIRGLLMYHGAATGRWAGRGIQPQNFPRGDEDGVLIPPFIKGRKGAGEIGMSLLIDAIKTKDWEWVETIYGDVYNALSSALRGFIIAEPGYELYVSDFSAIEARVLAWVAGEQWKLDAFAAIDRKEGYKGSEDIYLATASMIFGYPCLTKKTHGKERQTGKTCELAFGYQGGVGAWRKFDDSDKWTDAEVDEHKKGWRASHPNIQRFWYNIEATAIAAVLTGKAQSYRGITYAVVNSSVGKWLACRLPNGRCLWYYDPEVIQEGEWNGQPKYVLYYDGKDNKRGGAWGRISTYGGMLTENIVQAISRDLMVEAMFRVEAAGYPIILTVHDEIVCERKIGTGGDIKEFNRLMSIVPSWCPGMVIGVAGWFGTRYRKD